jgi:histidinol-phosphate aminotransferase
MSTFIRKSVEELQAYTPGEQPKVEGLIKLNTNENPYPPSPAVARALKTMPVDSLRFYPDPVCSALRERIADINGCTPEQVFVGNGSDEVLRLCMRAFTQPGGAVASFTPSYSLYPVLAESEELDYLEVLLQDDFSWTDPPADLAATVFFLANPNAPTGVFYAEKTLQVFSERFPGVVVLDEAYVDFAGGGNSWNWVRNTSNTLVCRTLSKSFSLAGLRLGYAIGSPDLIGALYKLKDSYNVDRLAQTVALAALEDLEWMQDNVQRVVTTRKRVESELEKRGFRVIPSGANFLFVEPPADWGAADLFEKLRAQKILVRYFPGGRTGAFLRVSIGTDAEMDAFLLSLSA